MNREIKRNLPDVPLDSGTPAQRAISRHDAALERVVKVLWDAHSLIQQIYDAQTGTARDMCEVLERETRETIAAVEHDILDTYAEDVHRQAVTAAAQICRDRAQSLYEESRNPVAANEATKCGEAIAREIASRVALISGRPWLLDGDRRVVSVGGPRG